MLEHSDLGQHVSYTLAQDPFCEVFDLIDKRWHVGYWKNIDENISIGLVWLTTCIELYTIINMNWNKVRLSINKRLFHVFYYVSVMIMSLFWRSKINYQHCIFRSVWYLSIIVVNNNIVRYTSIHIRIVYY